MTENCPCQLTSAEWEVLEMIERYEYPPDKRWVTACIESLERFELIEKKKYQHYLTERGEIIFRNRKVFT